MAADTPDKRASAVDIAQPWRSALPLPDGSEDQGDRQQALGYYRGILWQSGAASVMGDGAATAPVGRASATGWVLVRIMRGPVQAVAAGVVAPVGRARGLGTVVAAPVVQPVPVVPPRPVRMLARVAAPVGCGSGRLSVSDDPIALWLLGWSEEDAA